jgi:flagellar hook assembly protein FlgD
MEAGYHNVRWHGTNTVGNAVASGLYIVKFKANNFTGSQKVILVK